MKSFYTIVLAILTSAVFGMRASAAAEEAEIFDVYEYRILGNTVLPAVEIEKLVYPSLGQNKSLADVETVRKQLEALYRDRGYGTVFVDIPEQDVVGGLVRLKVTEGRLDRVRIVGARYFSNGRIRSELISLTAGEVLQLPQLQTDLSRLNRQSSDRQITPVLRAGRVPGAVDIDLKVEDNLPVHGNVEVNDRYTSNTSETRASLSLGYDNLFQRYHRLSLQYQTAPEKPEQVRVFATTYVAPWFDSNNLLAVYAVDTKSDFATIGAIGSLSVLGTGRIYGLRFIDVLSGSDQLQDTVTWGADYKQFEDSILQPDTPTDTTPIEYVTWSVQYDATVRGERTVSRFYAGLNLGIRGLLNEPEEFEQKRFNANSNFFSVRVGSSVERQLPLGTHVEFKLAGQYTNEPLISNEQFAIGGAESVRGYLESTQLGDSGAAASIQIHSPALNAWWQRQIRRLDAFVFYDAGVVRINEPLTANGQTISRVNLASYGAGMRLAGLGGLSAELDWAYPLKPADDIERGDSRIHFQLRYGF